MSRNINSASCLPRCSTESSTCTNEQFKIPIVDFSSFLSSTIDSADAPSPPPSPPTLCTAQQKTAGEIDTANRQHGFVCLRNTGISKSILDSTFSATQSLFDLNDNMKNTTLKQIDPLSNTGYAGYGVEALNRRRRPDLKEAFNVRHPKSSSSSSLSSSDSPDVPDFYHGTPPEFQNYSLKLWNELQILGYKYAICCAFALGFETDYFVKTLSAMDLCTLRMLHYPPCDDIVNDGNNDNDNNSDYDKSKSTSMAIRVGEHTDFGIFTFLFVRDFQDSSSHGLQVKAVEGGDLGTTNGKRKGKGGNNNSEHLKFQKKVITNEDGDDDDNHAFYLEGWNDVVFDKETIQNITSDESCAVIVNTGALMARWTNDIWRATAHRVIVPTAEARLSHRYSIAMFFDPDRETDCSVHPKLIEESGGKVKYEPIKSIDYLLMKLNEAQGIKN